MQERFRTLAIVGALLVAQLGLLFGCGTKVGTGLNGNVTIQSNPLAGSGAAAILRDFSRFALLHLLGEQLADAGVSSFTAFKACNDTMQFIDAQGNTISLAGSASSSVGAGLLTFSPTSTSAMTIGSVNIPSGTVIKEVDITFAVVPSVCSGAGYAVEFDPGTGPIDITQNTAFKFPFSGTNFTVNGSAQTVTLLFGQIVNGMVSLGSGLNNSSIQGVDVGQAK